MIGYFGEIFYVIAIIQAYMFINGGILLLFVSICLIHQAFSRMFLHSLNQLNDIDGINCTHRELLCKLIRFRSRIKESVFLLYNCCNLINFER